LRDGQKRITSFLNEHGLEEHAENDGMLRQLRVSEQTLREKHGIESTLAERLAKAVEDEDFETAAKLRDQLRTRDDGRTSSHADS
jgi:protein-arginine kinase activator protein McsA